MTWKSHTAIALGCTLPFNPIGIPFALLGSTAPDWSEWILKFFGINVAHRGFTHYLYIPIILIILGLIFHKFLFWFGIGYLTHWFADSLTRMGVPISQWDNHRVHFFGGKIVTGQPLEYIVSFTFLFISIAISQSSILHTIKGDREETFNAYYTEYAELYDKSIIDEKTYKMNKFKLF